jgi:hypothetical protein
MRSGRGTPVETGLRPVSVLTFHPVRRDESEGRVLRGTGPWAIGIVLPFGAVDGPYRVSIVRADGIPLPGRDTTLAAEAAGQISLLVSSLPAPGPYRVIVRPSTDPTGEEIYDYPFTLLAEPGPGRDGRDR